ATVEKTTGRPWLRLWLGLALVVGCSELTVSSIVRIAEMLDVDQAVISVLIIGLGTSLPELSISLGAILRKRVHLSVGNIIGSNIFDTLVPISAAALLSPVLVGRSVVVFDLPFAFFLTLTVLYFFVRKKGLQRHEAGIVLVLYAFYVGIKLIQL
ncbi:MAG: hypothetical protein R3348_06185, partial [Xanthomonadales bacterium]|nr:hypothetical protein [Xanthomonadales bacterium]